jgi:hypothetical protein
VLAGGDSATRAAVREELLRGEPRALVFEADDVWDLLQLAPRASLVVLAGDLQDAPAASLVRLLGHRHPELNVISPAGATAKPATGR